MASGPCKQYFVMFSEGLKLSSRSDIYTTWGMAWASLSSSELGADLSAWLAKIMAQLGGSMAPSRAVYITSCDWSRVFLRCILCDKVMPCSLSQAGSLCHPNFFCTSQPQVTVSKKGMTLSMTFDFVKSVDVTLVMWWLWPWVTLTCTTLVSPNQKSFKVVLVCCSHDPSPQPPSISGGFSGSFASVCSCPLGVPVTSPLFLAAFENILYLFVFTSSALPITHRLYAAFFL